MDMTIIHVDMDAFFAAVEVRDNPELAGKPLIIGALPHERGVVSTCSYEARKFGIHSAMSIKDAYKRCPHGIYMHPNMQKYKDASSAIHKIWATYTDTVEYISLDEGYLDVTGSMLAFGGPEAIGREIKKRTKQEIGLTCSVGIGYSMASAKLASEEKKPDGFFVIPDKEVLQKLIINRETRIIYGVGKKTAERLENVGIYTVQDILRNEQMVKSLLGKHGQQIIDFANGIDSRQVTPHNAADAKSIGREYTFQQDVTDLEYLKSVLRLIAKDLSLKLRAIGMYSQTITLKVTYANMKSISRSKSGDATDVAEDIYTVAADFLDEIEHAPIRLVGISVSNFTDKSYRQLSLDGGFSLDEHVQIDERKADLENKLMDLQQKYGKGIIKTGIELKAEKYLAGTGFDELK